MKLREALICVVAAGCALYVGAAFATTWRPRGQRPQSGAGDFERAALRAEILSLRRELRGARQGEAVSQDAGDVQVAAAKQTLTQCVWTLHPGVTLGKTVATGQWRYCAEEGGMCSCDNGRRVRFAGGTPRHLSVRKGHAIRCDASNFPSVGTAAKQCECEEAHVENPTTLVAAQARCASIGSTLCKGVGCVAGATDECTPRDGKPFLTPDGDQDAWVRECSEPAAQMGGGHSGQHHVDGEPTIFVSMASFRDGDAHNTLRSMFEKAKHPRRLFVGVVCQMYPGEDQPCVPADWNEACQRDLYCPSDQVRLRTFHAQYSEGPTHARGLAAAMYRGEDFFLMMDAHNRFVADWDEKLVMMHRSCPSERCVLSHYPQGLNMSDPENPHPLFTPPGTPLEADQQVAYLCNGEWHERSLIKNFRAMMIPVGSQLHPQPYSGAGLLFGPGRMIIEVPFDPHLRYVWDGEEFLYNARLWTWGYDLYSPYDNILFHHYNRPGAKQYHAEKSYRRGGTAREASSYRRLQYILGMTHKGTSEPMVDPDTQEHEVVVGLPKYGLGMRRNMSEFWRYARGDPLNRKGDPTKFHSGFFCTRCRGASFPRGCMYEPQ